MSICLALCALIWRGQLGRTVALRWTSIGDHSCHDRDTRSYKQVRKREADSLSFIKFSGLYGSFAVLAGVFVHLRS
jgi:hypothetical protein